MFLGRMQFSPSCPCPSSFCDCAKMALTSPFTPSRLTSPCGTPSAVVPSSPRELGSVRFGSGCSTESVDPALSSPAWIICHMTGYINQASVPWSSYRGHRQLGSCHQYQQRSANGGKGISSRRIFAMSLPPLVMPAPTRGSTGAKPPATYQER
jgi:hypothetical protein